MPMTSDLRSIRRRTARRIGFFLARTVTTGASSSITDTGHPIKSSNLQEELLAGKWILRPDAANANDRVRVVAENGYNPAAGQIQPDADWNTPAAGGEVYELHGAVEPWDEMNDIINTALERLFIVSEIAVAATAGAHRHGLNTAAPWLQTAWHVRQVGVLAQGESRNVTDPFRRTFWGHPEADDGGIYLEHPAQTFGDGDTIYVRCLKPARYACRASSLGLFGDITGLSADAHQAPVALDWIAAAAAVEYWERYAGTLSEGDPDAKSAEARQMKAAADFDTQTAANLRVPPVTYKTLPIATGMAGRY